jgi:outer membrane receptor protein involved in Fe transport
MYLILKSSVFALTTFVLGVAGFAAGQEDASDQFTEDAASACVLSAPYGPPNDDLRLNRPNEQAGCGTSTLVLRSIDVYGDRPFGRPGSFSALTSTDIEDTLADHPAEILNQLPGTNVQMNSGQEHLIAIRSPVLTGGAGQGSFLILENGVPTRSPAFGNVNALLEPHHEIADAIEVVRGPGSARYGSNAVHGLVNTIYGQGGHGSKAQASFGSLGRYKGDVVYDELESYNVAVSLHQDTGWRDNTGVDQQKLTVTGEQFVGRWTIRPMISLSNLEQETAAFLQGPDAYKDRDLAKTNAKPEAYRNAFSARAASRFEAQFGSAELTLTPYVHTQSMQFAQHFLPNGGVEKNGHTGGGVLAQIEREVSDRLTYRIGADADIASGYLKEVQLQPFGFFPGDSRFPEGIHYDYSVDTMMGAFWGEAEWTPMERLTILAGLRVEEHRYDYATDTPPGTNGRFQVSPDRSDNFSLLTPKLGAIYDAGDISYYANYARGQRAPQASDLYRLQSRQVPGQIDEETLDSFEVGLRGNRLDGRIVFDIAAYWMEKDNFFFRDSDGLNVPNGSTEHKGIEIAANFEIADQLTLSGQVSWSDQVYTFDRITRNGSETIRNGNQIDTAPEWLGDVSLTWEGDRGARVGLSAEYVGEYFTNPSNTRRYGGHTIVNARASYPFAGGLEGFAIVRNLTDEAYADRADFAFGNERYFPGEPLNVTLGIRKEF